MIPKLLVLIVILYIVYKLMRIVRRGLPAGNNKPGKGINTTGGEDLVQDPLCRTYIPISQAIRASIEGKSLYFCSQECLERYSAERGKRA